jgi:hypothetical protein
MNRTLFLAAIALLITCAFISCKSGVKQQVYDNPDAGCRILITGATSEFKDAVLSDLVDRYRDTCQVEIKPVGTLGKKDFLGYAAIVIMDECQAWMAFNTTTMGLINKIEDKEKIILFITAGDPDWTFSTQGIDAVTSASEMAKKEEVAGRIASRIDQMIQ